MALDNNPVVLDEVNESYAQACKVIAIVWVGTTTEGDNCILQHRVSGNALWEGLASTTNTYQGVTLSAYGVSCPTGFKVTTLDAGKVLVYLREE